jgi:hypothetical protein
MNHRKWNRNSVCHMQFVDVEAEHNVLYEDWKKVSLELERFVVANGALCDRITELESVRIDSYTDFIGGYQIFGSMESVKAVKKIVSDLRDTYREVMDENNRLCRDINEANHALKQTIHVPFSDAQIEKMAAAAFQTWNAGHRWANAIRAALAAGGLEPCAVPLNTERASDDELVEMGRDGFDRFYDQECGDKESIDAYYAAIRAVRSRVEAPLLAEIKQSDEALRRVNGDYERTRAELTASQARVAELEAEMEPTGHVQRDVAGLRAKIENQRMTLRQLHEARARDAVDRMNAENEFVSVTAERDSARAELAAVKAERDKAVDERNQHIKREYTSWETEFRKVEAERDELKKSSELLSVVYKGEMDARKSAQSELAALRQRDAVPVKVRFDVTAALVEEVFSAGDWVAYSWQAVMDYLAAHAVIDAPAGVASVEELHQLGVKTCLGSGMCFSSNYTFHWHQYAAAIRDAVLAGVGTTYKRNPANDGFVDIPTPEQVEALARALRAAQFGDIPHPDWEYGKKEDWCRAARAAFAHIGRVPVGWELDVTADELAAKMWGFFDAQVMAPQILDICRSRIRPVYECKECIQWRNANNELVRRADAARAALEGE